MSEVPASTIQIYIQLLDEGSPVARPTEAKIVGPGEFLVLPTPDYDPEDEHWEFPPGSVVQCVRERGHDGDDFLLAQKRLR